jgi:hypothetical protein
LTIKVPPTVAAAFAFAIQVIVGVLLFGAVTLAAVTVHWLIGLCEAHHLLPPTVDLGMHGLELFLWGADVVCFALFVAVEVWRFFVRMWDALRG